MIKDEYNPKHTPEVSVEREGNVYKVTVEIGKEVKHPNEFSHYIAWIKAYLKPEDGEYVEVFEGKFVAHGEYNIKTNPKVTFQFEFSGKGKLMVVSYCNIHGLWKKEVELE